MKKKKRPHYFLKVFERNNRKSEEEYKRDFFSNHIYRYGLYNPKKSCRRVSKYGCREFDDDDDDDGNDDETHFQRSLLPRSFFSNCTHTHTHACNTRIHMLRFVHMMMMLMILMMMLLLMMRPVYMAFPCMTYIP